MTSAKPERRGPGRPRGKSSVLTEKARAEAKLSGLLPHEWLLKVARGEPVMQARSINIVNKKGAVIGQEIVIEEVYADFATRVEAAKAAAPYYAPRLATHYIDMVKNTEDKPPPVQIVFSVQDARVIEGDIKEVEDER